MKEVPREVKEGKKRERRRIQRKWVRKNKKWILLGCAVAIALFVLMIICLIAHLQRKGCYLIHNYPEEVTEIRVDDKKCNSVFLGTFDFSQYKNLKRVVIGNDCYKHVRKVTLVGLSELESVVIGRNSFTKNKDGKYPNSSKRNRRFYLKNCPKLKSLKMGRFAFTDYSVVEIENVNALQTIEMGVMSEWSNNFFYASLELKSDLVQIE